MNSEQEQILVKKAQTGNREALGLLWDEVTPKLFGYLINTTHNKTIAEDMLQATWLKAIEALPRFQPRGIVISAWLFAIARNELRQQWRKAGRETAFDTSLHDVPAENNDQTEQKILVEQMLNKLSEDDR